MYFLFPIWRTSISMNGIIEGGRKVYFEIAVKCKLVSEVSPRGVVPERSGTMWGSRRGLHRVSPTLQDTEPIPDNRHPNTISHSGYCILSQNIKCNITPWMNSDVHQSNHLRHQRYWSFLLPPPPPTPYMVPGQGPTHLTCSLVNAIL